MDYFSPFWGPKMLSIVVEPQGVLTCWSSTLAVVANSCLFHGLLLAVSCNITNRFWAPKQFPKLLNPKVCLRVGHQHSQFCPILSCFLDYYSLFSGPVVISRLTNPRVRLRVGHQHSWFLLILARFVDNYSPFCGPEPISMVVELQGALTCRSSTITIWADSGPFLGLLLYFGVSESFL